MVGQIDEKAFASAMTAYCPQTQGQPDPERLRAAILAYEAERSGDPSELRLGSRINVSGSEAVVMPFEGTRRIVEILAYHPVREGDRAQAEELYRAIVSEVANA